MPNQIWSKISTLLAVAFLTFGLVSLCMGKVGMSLWGFGFAAVLLTYSVLRWTEFGQEVWAGITSPSPRAPAHRPVGAYAPLAALPTVRPSRNWTAWFPSLGATMWLAILATALSMAAIAFGNFLWGVVFLAFAGMALIFHHEKQEEVWAWLKSTAWPFVRTHWMWLWLAISVVGVLWTLMANGYLSTLYGWILSTILAALTAFGLWEGIMGQVSRALSGQNGASITLITWSMLLAGLAGLLHSLVPSDHQLEIIGWIAGLSMVLFWGGICRGVYEIKSKK